MTAEEKRKLDQLSDTINNFKLEVTNSLTEIHTTLKSYPKVKDQVYENKDSISGVKTVWSTIIGLAFIVQVGITIYLAM